MEKTKKTVKKEIKPKVTKEVDSKKTTKTKTSKSKDISVSTYSKSGVSTGKTVLPTELFGVVANKQLIIQSIRVYQTNQRVGSANTRTRGMVTGSTRKIYRQKGTGRARHGDIKAPIFVGGGVVSGPQFKDYSMKMSKKMRRQALLGSLSTKVVEESVFVLSGLKEISSKTKDSALLIKKILPKTDSKVLVLLAKDSSDAYKAMRNIRNVSVLDARQVNTYEVLKNDYILLMKEAIEEMKEHFIKNN